MRIFDGLRVFPSIILALAVVAATGQSLINVVLVLGFWIALYLLGWFALKC